MRALTMLLAIFVCHAHSTFAQTPSTLTEQLLAEDPKTLAADAMRKGDAVRGAILFAQKSLNCASCHAQNATDLVGPDLTRKLPAGQRPSDDHYVDAILRPSKTIAKGFEAVKLLTVDGQLLAGRIVSQDADSIVLRESSSRNRLVTIPRNDVEQLQNDTVSAMPEKLADQLENRQQFLDLVRYVLDIADSGSAEQAGVSQGMQGRPPAKHLRGLALIDQFGCINCHAAESMVNLRSGRLPQKLGPDLQRSAVRIDPEYLKRLIADPHGTKPGTKMPNVMATLTDDQRASTAEAIVHYLASLDPGSFRLQPIDRDAAARGRDVFHQVGCVACHSPRDDAGKELLPQSSVALGDISAKYSLDELTGFLEKPHLARPSMRMPNMGLSHWEAIEIASYLLDDPATPAQEASGAAFVVDSELAKLGASRFRELACVQCHQIPSESGARKKYPALAEANPNRGCLSEQQGSWPSFQMTDDQREAIRAAIESHEQELSPREQVALSLHTLRCDSCHQRDGIGGVSDERDLYFATENENLGPQGRIPPVLTGVGGKLKSKWLRQVLVSGRSIRPYMKTRMPQFGFDNVGHLIDLFPAVDPKPDMRLPDPGDPKETKKIGTELVGSAGLNCVACHTFQLKPSQTMPAVDLTEMAERLHPEWFHQYMLSPQSLSPNTVMPSFWPGGKAIRKEFLDGDPDRQIGAVWEYLLDGRQARTPRGLRIEPIELLAEKDRAVMLRRNYRDIGKRGIGVGYPLGVNLAYDAEQMRLAMIWKGRFADPGAAWRGQGSGTVRPLGTDLIQFQRGPDVDDQSSPWIVDEGRPPNHRFTGYQLDDRGRPTFSYRVGDTKVHDGFVDIDDTQADQIALKRTITITPTQSSATLLVRLADGKKITPLEDGNYQVDGSLRIQVDRASRPVIHSLEDRQALVVPIDLADGNTTISAFYRW